MNAKSLQAASPPAGVAARALVEPVARRSAMPMPALAPRAGVGLKPQHFNDVLQSRPEIGFFEVHAENYMVDGGSFHHFLGRIREHYALSLHGVGLSIGGTEPPDENHLGRLAALIDRYQPALFSEHLAWSSHGGTYYNDLLPLPYDKATLQRVCDHVDTVQERLRRRMLLENPSTYVEFESSTLSEAQFLREIIKRTGCGLLLDVNNAYVSCVNHGREVLPFLDELPLDAVGQIHLAGFASDNDSLGARLLIDSHGSPVDAAVWRLYAAMIERLGPLATLIERDNDVPAFEVLLAEAQRAEQILAAAASGASTATLANSG